MFYERDVSVLQTERMKYSVFGVYLAAILAATAACSDNPNPSQPSSSNSGLTASVAAPLPVSPGNNAQIKNTEQPTSDRRGLRYAGQLDVVDDCLEVIAIGRAAGERQTKDDVCMSISPRRDVETDDVKAAALEKDL